jgi:antitoxin component YwqK of YwqJK toxin-antitoxin module
MLKKSICIGFIIGTIVVSSFSKPECNTEKKELVGKDTVIKKIECYKEGDWEITRLLNDELHGQSESFYASGQKRNVATFNKGNENGIRQGWTEDGFLTVYKPYRNGIPVDTHKVWFPNKRQESITIYDSTGNKNGWCRTWYESGILQDSTLFFHGDKLQEYLFYLTGKLRFTSVMKPDSYILSAESFDEKGKNIGRIAKGNGRVILVNDNGRHDTLVVKDGKVQNAAYEFFKNR